MRNLLLFSLCLFFGLLRAQTTNFIHYTPGNQINDMAKDGETLWIATNGGVAQINTSNGQTVFYNRSNSNLPINEISSIAIGPDGTRWLGTRIGLVQWQGNTFTVLNPTGSGGVQVQLWITKVRVDGAGHAWVNFPGHNANMARFDGQNWLVVDEEALFSGSSDFKTLPQAPGIWVLNDGEKLFYRYDGTDVTTYPMPVGLEETPGTGSIDDWQLDALGDIWFTVGNQLCVPQDNSWIIEEMDVWPDGLTVADDGTLWVASDFDGIYKRMPDGNWQTCYDNYLPIDVYGSTLVVSPSGSFWVGTEEQGLYRLANNVLEKMPSGVADIPEGSVVQLEVSSTQTVWSIFDDQFIMDWMNGQTLARFHNQEWESLKEISPNQSLWKCKSMTKDGLDRLWIAHFDEIYRFDGVWEQIPKPAAFPFGQVYSVAADPNSNHVWMGGYGKFARYDGAGFQVFDAPTSTFMVQEMTIDHQGNVWMPSAGVSDIVYRFDGQSWIQYSNLDMGLTEFANYVREIKVAPNGDVWVLTPYEFTRFNGTNWEKFPLEAYSFGEFSTMTFDGPDKIWMGTYANMCFGTNANLQLIKIESEAIHFYPYKTTPLPYPNITALAVDAHHNVWIGCQQGGIAVFNENGITLKAEEAVPEENRPQMQARVFPNPANAQAMLEYKLPSASQVLIELRDASGRLLLRHACGMQQAGLQSCPLYLQHLPKGPLSWRVVSDDALASGWLVVE